MSNLKKLVTNCNSFAILTHERPDGDAIASSLAMYWYLMKEKSEMADVDIDIIIPEFSRKFSFLPVRRHAIYEVHRIGCVAK